MIKEQKLAFFSAQCTDCYSGHILSKRTKQPVLIPKHEFLSTFMQYNLACLNRLYMQLFTSMKQEILVDQCNFAQFVLKLIYNPLP